MDSRIEDATNTARESIERAGKRIEHARRLINLITEGGQFSSHDGELLHLADAMLAEVIDEHDSAWESVEFVALINFEFEPNSDVEVATEATEQASAGGAP